MYLQSGLQTYLLYNGVIVIPAGHIDVDRLEGERKQEQQIPETQPGDKDTLR